MYKVTLKIEGMMCGMCEAHINETIRKSVKGAQKVASSHGKGLSTFICEEKPDEALLQEAIRRTGYELKGIGIEPYEKKKWSLFG